MAIAATFIMKFVKMSTKVATLNTNTSQCAFWNNKSHSTAIHCAAPVCQRQKPILMAPLKRRIIFQGISSSSLTVRTLNKKNTSVEQSRMAALSSTFKAGTKACIDMTAIAPNTMIITNFSSLVMGPISFKSPSTLSFRPLITFFSGFRKIMRTIQMTKTMTHPIKNIYFVSSKKLIYFPVN